MNERNNVPFLEFLRIKYFPSDFCISIHPSYCSFLITVSEFSRTVYKSCLADCSYEQIWEPSYKFILYNTILYEALPLKINVFKQHVSNVYTKIPIYYEKSLSNTNSKIFRYDESIKSNMKYDPGNTPF